MGTIECMVPAKVTVSAIVFRCGCGHPESHESAVCPTPIQEDLGILVDSEDTQLSIADKIRAWMERK
jgi:hypothetical protein